MNLFRPTSVCGFLPRQIFRAWYRSWWLTLFGAFAALLSSQVALAQVSSVERVSLNNIGVPVDGDCVESIVSQDGNLVVFVTSASNLSALDTNGVADVYLYNRTTQRVTLISQGSDSTASDGPSGLATDSNGRGISMSADGNLIAFSSTATNLVAGDINNKRDIFIYDVLGGQMIRASQPQNINLESDGDSFNPALSADGTYLAFDSVATNMLSLDQNNKRDVFLYNVGQRNLIDRVSRVGTFSDANDDSFLPVLDADGTHIAYGSQASDIVSGDTNGAIDIFLYNRRSSTTTRISLSSLGVESNGNASRPSINSDGTLVAFEATATNLVPNDTNGATDIFVRNITDSTTTRVSIRSNGRQGNGNSTLPAMSDDGRYVAFESLATNLVDGDQNGALDVFLFDLQTSKINRLSLSSSGASISNGSLPGLSGNGLYVSFTSSDSSTTSGGSGTVKNVYLSRVAQVITPDLDIQEPPEVNVPSGSNTVRITMPSFSGQSLSLSSSALPSAAVELREARRKKLNFMYQVRNTFDPSLALDVRERLSQRNSVLLKNIPAGTHQISYRMIIRRGKKQVSATELSPSVSYSVP